MKDVSTECDLMLQKPKVLFVCTANAARSQMAEGYLRAKYSDRYEVFSAGTRKARVSTRAIEVMQEIGIDISHHHSKTLDEIGGMQFDIAVTLCDNAHQLCPIIPNAGTTIHKGFFDPHLTAGNNTDVLAGYRSVRDEIVRWIDEEFKKEI
jgi:arsenate reductase